MPDSTRRNDARQTIRALVHLARLGWVSPEEEAAEAEEKYQAIRQEIAAEVRTEVLADAKTETVAWLFKKAAEQPMWDAATLASKVDRGAVRIFLGSRHCRDAMDAHRTEALREAEEVVVRAARAAGDDERAQYVAGVLAGVAKELRRIAEADR